MREEILPGDWSLDIKDKTERGVRTIYVVANRVDNVRSPIMEEVFLGKPYEDNMNTLPEVAEAFAKAKKAVISRVIEVEALIERDRQISFEIDAIRKNKQ